MDGKVSHLLDCSVPCYGAIVFRHNPNAVEVKHKACGLALVLLIPPLVTWVPFVWLYGLSEAACWIKLSENSTCDYDYIGLVLWLCGLY